MTFKLHRRQFILTGAAAVACGRSEPFPSQLDTALINGRVWAGERGVFSDALGISGGRIAAMGGDAVSSLITPATRVIDLDGACVMPSFIDCHTHFIMGSSILSKPDFLSLSTRQEFIDRIGAATRKLPERQWLTGSPWDEQRWGGELPDRSWIDGVSGGVPVAIPRTDLHSLFLNSAALDIVGIDETTPDVPGGIIERDENGVPTGVLKDNARLIVFDFVPDVTDAMVDQTVRDGMAHALSQGVTQVHNTEIDWSVQNSVRRLRQAGPTDIRFYSMVPMADWERMADLVQEEGYGDDWVRWGALKCLSDGSLGARTARFHQPYTDRPDQRGVWAVPIETMREWIPAVDAAGLNMTVHAIGDHANDVVLDIFAETVRRNGPRDRRFRIEHAQHLSPGAWARMAAQDVIASVQPYHAIDDGRWAASRIGQERLPRAFAFRSLIDAGVLTSFGSDWPVAPISPIKGLDAAVMRQTTDGANPDGWYPEQRVNIEDALLAYTTNAAYAGFQEDRLGRLAPGYIADLVVLDTDLLRTEPEKIAQTEVLRTFVGGVEKYTASSA